MNTYERNKKAAISRWNKVIEQEKAKIINTSRNLALKAAICGFLAGDGSVFARKERTYLRYDTAFYPDDRLMLDTYLDAVRQVYGKALHITTKEGVFYVKITSRTIVEDLLQYANFGIHKWTLPDKLFTIKGTKEAWLRAFFSAESYVGNSTVRVQTVNIRSMLEVSKLLTSIGIQNNYYEYTPKNPKHSKVGIVIIASKKARQLFYEKIGFWHSKKQEKLRKALGL